MQVALQSSLLRSLLAAEGRLSHWRLTGSHMVSEPHTAKPLTGRAVTHPKRCVEDCLRLDLATLRKAGVLDSPPGTPWKVTASSGFGHVTYSVVLDGSPPEALSIAHVDDDGVVLNRQHFALESTPQHLGGHRYWFRCECGRRVRVLFLPPQQTELRCRHCWRLTYRARQMHRLAFYEQWARPLERLERAAKDLRSRSPRRKLRGLRNFERLRGRASSCAP